MMSQHTLVTSILSAMLLLAIASTVSSIGTAFAQQELGITDTTTTTTDNATTEGTTTAATDATSHCGINRRLNSYN
jgi:hypothetical protein